MRSKQGAGKYTDKSEVKVPGEGVTNRRQDVLLVNVLLGPTGSPASREKSRPYSGLGCDTGTRGQAAAH